MLQVIIHPDLWMTTHVPYTASIGSGSTRCSIHPLTASIDLGVGLRNLEAGCWMAFCFSCKNVYLENYYNQIVIICTNIYGGGLWCLCWSCGVGRRCVLLCPSPLGFLITLRSSLRRMNKIIGPFCRFITTSAIPSRCRWDQGRCRRVGPKKHRGWGRGRWRCLLWCWTSEGSWIERWVRRGCWRSRTAWRGRSNRSRFCCWFRCHRLGSLLTFARPVWLLWPPCCPLPCWRLSCRCQG